MGAIQTRKSQAAMESSYFSQNESIKPNKTNWSLLRE
jgi:hypothetical protein